MVACQARFSPCGRYRYALTRHWDNGPTATFVMLNPSTADAAADDHTIRKCIGFARRWRCGRLLVVNLFAFRATDPKKLKRARQPVGPENGRILRNALRAAAKRGDLVVCAWGAHGKHRGQDRAFVAAVADWPEIVPVCLGVTRNGQPRHPLRAAYSTPLVPWQPDAG